MLNKLNQLLWNYKINRLLPDQPIQETDLEGVLTIENIGPQLYIRSWPGIGVFIAPHNQEPNNVTYIENELFFVSYTSIDTLCRYVNISRYNEQQLN